MRRIDHSIGNGRIESDKIVGYLVEIIAVGYSRVSYEVAETGVDSGSQDDAICRL